MPEMTQARLWMANATQIDPFTRAYLRCAFWSSNDESDERGGDPLEDNYNVFDLAEETLRKVVVECDRFQAENAADIGDRWADAGHDFWLTRNGHGCGFWDGDWADAGDRLTEASERAGSCDLYIGDDGLIYQSGGTD
jgi:hypothetical protein